VGDSEDVVRRAERLIVSILYADDENRNRIRQEQLKIAEDLNTTLYPYGVDESMMTPYGPASPTVGDVPPVIICRRL
jgi:hypothetical protein